MPLTTIFQLYRGC